MSEALCAMALDTLPTMAAGSALYQAFRIADIGARTHGPAPGRTLRGARLEVSPDAPPVPQRAGTC